MIRRGGTNLKYPIQSNESISKPENLFFWCLRVWWNFYFFAKEQKSRARKVPTCDPGMVILLSLNQWFVNIAKL